MRTFCISHISLLEEIVSYQHVPHSGLAPLSVWEAWVSDKHRDLPAFTECKQENSQFSVTWLRGLCFLSQKLLRGTQSFPPVLYLKVFINTWVVHKHLLKIPSSLTILPCSRFLFLSGSYIRDPRHWERSHRDAGASALAHPLPLYSKENGLSCLAHHYTAITYSQSRTFIIHSLKETLFTFWNFWFSLQCHKAMNWKVWTR